MLGGFNEVAYFQNKMQSLANSRWTNVSLSTISFPFLFPSEKKKQNSIFFIF